MMYFRKALINVLILTTNINDSARTRRHQSNDSSQGVLDWLIVGGGLHGTHIGAHLASKGIDNFAIVDEESELLFKWKRRTNATGMKYMRSSATFHLDVDKNSLIQFAAHQYDHRPQAKSKKKKKMKMIVRGNSDLFSSDYDRPSLELFNSHCDHVVKKYCLDQRHIMGTVQCINLEEDVVAVTFGGLDTRTIQARKVVLALGSDDPSYPSWARHGGNSIPHLLDVKSSLPNEFSTLSNTAIIGGGISAVHKALDIVSRKKVASSKDAMPLVHIISRHEVVEQQFDTHQEWMMDQDGVERSLKAGGSGLPQRQVDFRQLQSYHQRRKVIQKERRPGTIPASLSRKGLLNAIRANQVEWHVGDITSVTPLEDQKTCFQVTAKDGTMKNIVVDHVLLATGFGTKPPDSDTIVSQLVKSAKLPVSPHCGYPIVDSNLRWSHPRLFVMGALAELELGPSARNLAGARMAAERILGL